MTDRPDMRISDADRRAAGERLRLALSEGRLDFAEYDARLARAYGAVTYRDLDDLFADLPTTGSALAPAPRFAVPAPPRAVHLVPRPLKVLGTAWLAVAAVSLTVWLLVSIGNGGIDYFWPIWLLVPGAALFGVTVGVVGSRSGRDRRS
jgi:Domain of unknown function (DUF1707)